MNELSLILIDSSMWISALRAQGSQEAKRRVAELLNSGRAALTQMILLELWQGTKTRIEMEHLQSLERDLPLLSITTNVWKRSYDLARKCRARGFAVPLSDVLIAACAIEHRVTIEHDDNHFCQIQQVLGTEIKL